MLKHLYVQVLIGLAAGILVGHFAPVFGVQMKPLGDTFIRLIKMLITLVIFCTAQVVAKLQMSPSIGRVWAITPSARPRALPEPDGRPRCQ
ncbi:cation:dicarboxylase symporter family transporter [Paraburkholderia sp. BR13439]|uniref:cation:dicarboxylate symporter family transporter n=1 Tax=Paraburkholderia TaxID=1822464 RepID=UPI0034D01E22